MKNLIGTILVLILLLLLASCATNKVRPKRTTVTDLATSNRLYGVDRNPYFYFMLDSMDTPHLVKTHMFKSSKVIWIEKLTRIRK